MSRIHDARAVRQPRRVSPFDLLREYGGSRVFIFPAAPHCAAEFSVVVWAHDEPYELRGVSAGSADSPARGIAFGLLPGQTRLAPENDPGRTVPPASIDIRHGQGMCRRASRRPWFSRDFGSHGRGPLAGVAPGLC